MLQPLYPKSGVSRDIVFDESTSWYIVDSVPSKPIESLEIDLEEDDQLGLTPEESPISTGPHELPNDQSTY